MKFISNWIFSAKLMSGRRALVLAGLLLIALNLRPAIASISPLLEQIRVDLRLSYAMVSLLTTLPTICMGLFAFIAAPIAQRVGQERIVFWAVVLIGLATIARFAGGNIVVLFATTILVGVGIAIIQALLPSLVKKYFENRAALVTGLYTVCLIGGATIAAGVTVPLENILGTWTAALAVWGVLAVVAVVVWGPVAWGKRPPTIDGSNREELVTERVTVTQLPWRSWWAWILALFLGGSSFLYFATLTWLAPFYQSLGWSTELSGILLTVFTIGEIGGTLSVTAFTDRFPDRRPAFALTLGACILGFGAMALVPLAYPWIWAIVAGGGIGGLFDLTLVLPIDYAPTAEGTSRLSSMVIGVGYLLSALGPLVVGILRGLIGGYEISFFVFIGICVVMLIVSLRFRPGDTIQNV
jgi:CP family cyanate transporter-like MFS transporter